MLTARVESVQDSIEKLAEMCSAESRQIQEASCATKESRSCEQHWQRQQSRQCENYSRGDEAPGDGTNILFYLGPTRECVGPKYIQVNLNEFKFMESRIADNDALAKENGTVI